MKYQKNNQPGVIETSSDVNSTPDGFENDPLTKSVVTLQEGIDIIRIKLFPPPPSATKMRPVFKSTLSPRGPSKRALRM